MFDTTKAVDAHYYLLDGFSVEKVGKRDWLRAAKRDMEVPGVPGREYGMVAYMFYIGSGFVPLAVAVLSGSESDAWSAIEQWAIESGRGDEVGYPQGYATPEDEQESVEGHCERIPYSVVCDVLRTQYR